jgi:hypothetical protein
VSDGRIVGPGRPRARQPARTAPDQPRQTQRPAKPVSSSRHCSPGRVLAAEAGRRRRSFLPITGISDSYRAVLRIATPPMCHRWGSAASASPADVPPLGSHPHPCATAGAGAVRQPHPCATAGAGTQWQELGGAVAGWSADRPVRRDRGELTASGRWDVMIGGSFSVSIWENYPEKENFPRSCTR